MKTSRSTRLHLHMGVQDALVAMCDGNPGALTVCLDLLKKGKEIDPQNILEGLGNVMYLDTLGIYGSRIWMFYKDVCGQDLRKMIGVMRANQLGFLREDVLNHGIDNYGDGLDIEKACKAVEERIDGYRMEGPAEQQA